MVKMTDNTEAKATEKNIAIDIDKTWNIFSTFEELNAMVNQLKSNRHPIRVFNSQTVEDCNKKRLKATIPLKPVDEWWCYTYYSIRCVHYGQPRRRSKGIRPTRHHFAINWPFKLFQECIVILVL